MVDFQTTTLNVIGLLKLSDKKLSDNITSSEMVENGFFFKPITIEEIVIFRIKDITKNSYSRPRQVLFVQLVTIDVTDS